MGDCEKFLHAFMASIELRAWLRALGATATRSSVFETQLESTEVRPTHAFSARETRQHRVRKVKTHTHRAFISDVRAHSPKQQERAPENLWLISALVGRDSSIGLNRSSGSWNRSSGSLDGEHKTVSSPPSKGIAAQNIA